MGLFRRPSGPVGEDGLKESPPVAPKLCPTGALAGLFWERRRALPKNWGRAPTPVAPKKL
jgi:hypothetical protein